MAFTKEFMAQVVADCNGLMFVVRDSVVVTPEIVERAKSFVQKYSDILKYEGFEFSIHAWEDPDRGRANIGRTNRSKQNIASLHVAAGFLRSKAQRFVDSTTAGITLVPVTRADADEVTEAVADLNVSDMSDIIACYASSTEVRHDFEYMYGIAGGRLENWVPKSGWEWSDLLQMALDILPTHVSSSHPRRMPLAQKLVRIEDVILEFRADVSLTDDLNVLRTLAVMCLANDCKLVVDLAGGVAATLE